MVGGGRVLPGEDRVADVGRRGGEALAVRLDPGGKAGEFRAPWQNRGASSVGCVARRSGSSGSARQVPGYEVAASPCGAVSDWAMSARVQKQAKQPARLQLVERCLHKPRCAAIAPAPARPIRAQASGGPRRCRRRTRACSASGRGPRSAGGTSPRRHADRRAIGMAECSRPLGAKRVTITKSSPARRRGTMPQVEGNGGESRRQSSW